MAIIGHGFVGKATDWGFNIDVEKFIVDPVYNTTVDDMAEFKPEIAFVCVPTPMNEDGSQDSSIIESVVTEVSNKCKSTLVVVKSTVLPSVLKKLSEIHPKIVFNPEFLREKYAQDDFLNSKIIIFGGERKLSNKVAEIYQMNSRCICKDYVFMDLLSSSLVKYSINTFLATKVLFFNELYEVFKKLNVTSSWDQITDAIALDERIGSSHMQVPGPDGRKGFGGACFPKDTTALLKFSKDLGLSFDVLQSAIIKNNSYRRQYDELDAREKEQNVNFDNL